MSLSARHNLRRERIERVVVRGTNWVGDAVMTIPALRELRRVLPNAHITLATRRWAEGLFAGADFIDELLIYERGQRRLPSLLRQMREWRARKFDLAVLFQNAFEAALIATGGRVPARFGYATDGRRALLTHPIAVPAWRGERHEVFYYLNLVAELERALGDDSRVMEREPVFDLQVSAQRQQAARLKLRSAGAKESRVLLALCPGSTNSRAKRWPTARYAELADRLIDELDADVALVGSQEELEVSREVALLMRREPLMLTGRTRLDELVAILSLADALVTNDTGPAHIAAALGRPTLVIFGPTDPRTTRPFPEVAEILRRPPECAPCMLRDCPIDHRCMTAISPAEVFARTRALCQRHALEVKG